MHAQAQQCALWQLQQQVLQQQVLQQQMGAMLSPGALPQAPQLLAFATPPPAAVAAATATAPLQAASPPDEAALRAQIAELQATLAGVCEAQQQLEAADAAAAEAAGAAAQGPAAELASAP